MKMCSKQIIQQEKPSFKLINVNESVKCQVCQILKSMGGSDYDLSRVT